VPQGHHQVYFNDLHPEHFLLPDGTDKAHYPGPPFEQRLWAGGSLTYNPQRSFMMRYDTMGILQENIENVQVKGKEGQEKVFVTISRKVAMYSAINPHNKANVSNFPPNLKTLPRIDLEHGKPGPLAMEEKKILVFLRAKTEEERVENLESISRIIKRKRAIQIQLLANYETQLYMSQISASLLLQLYIYFPASQH
jgi:hydroxyacyl-ACP dehydratase HTD2-like protein with hotdog domain